MATQLDTPRPPTDESEDWSAFAHNLCMGLPQVQHVISHGASNYRIGRGKIFAVFTLNHHGDGRAALLFNAAPGTQERFGASKTSEGYFVPPYLGARGWLGVDLTRVDTEEVLERVREAYLHTLPERKRATAMPELAALRAPTPPKERGVAGLVPLQSALAAALLQSLRQRFANQPKVQESTSFGMPCWRIGTAKSSKAFLMLFEHQKQLALMLNAGAELQSWVLQEPHYFAPPYFGARGWVARVLTRSETLGEMEDLLTSCQAHAMTPKIRPAAKVETSKRKPR